MSDMMFGESAPCPRCGNRPSEIGGECPYCTPAELRAFYEEEAKVQKRKENATGLLKQIEELVQEFKELGWELSISLTPINTNNTKGEGCH